MSKTVCRQIRLEGKQHRKTGLIAVFSDDLPGLLVYGHTEEEIADKLPAAIREILEAQGHKVLSIDVEADEERMPKGFGPPAFIAHAALANAHNL